MSNVGDFIELGEALFHIRNPQASNVDSYLRDIEKFLRLLQECGLQRTFTAASPLNGVSIPHFRNRGIAGPASAQLITLSNSISSTLYDEANARQTILYDGGRIPESLTTLASVIGVTSLEPHQEALRQDLVLCLKAGAFRPAIVVAWALTFDLVRTWIISDTARLKEFNVTLQNRTQKTGVHQVVNFDDFFEVKETFVLDICRDAQGALSDFSQKTHRLLVNLLDERNGFAHANYNNATDAEAKSYIERCIRILSNKPFR